MDTTTKQWKIQDKFQVLPKIQEMQKIQDKQEPYPSVIQYILHGRLYSQMCFFQKYFERWDIFFWEKERSVNIILFEFI